ncbi:DUF2515 family protein [Pseudoduganella umbonata]|uniref:Uncharacterized protein n=1 Tax=Pseudoduganella umbonata TaxID=864828 RepID=A0A4P8HYU9_9BURK|nr:hypothetical protein [Pseudoduganella umbonata]MBB3225403.1 hypothetical protein [Pseudoduganella umbonata]QCP14168.1 hypothetical protein FCL38_29955 [Pseudoduganella umbonata]
MSKSNPIIGTTNTTPKSCVNTDCDCNMMWSLAQQFSTKRLCVQTGEHKGKLIRSYEVRARRIAATYARLYLETEEGGNPALKGRYYWMALGAFASKTVACTFATKRVLAMSKGINTVWEGLGKGNFWLFCDISGWHWYRNMYPKSFNQCLKARNTQNYVKEVKAQLNQLPWKDEALPIIKYLQVSNEVVAGFKKVDEYEDAPPRRRASIQFDHLMRIAEHEQGVILQPLIYEDDCFAGWIEIQRGLSWFTPTVELIFTHACCETNAELKSVAPEETKLEDYQSRMNWITDAAEQFHRLMQSKLPLMERELATMAGWKDMADDPTFRQRAIDAVDNF